MFYLNFNKLKSQCNLYSNNCDIDMIPNFYLNKNSQFQLILIFPQRTKNFKKPL